ncbi:hypothetical protein PVAND_005100 [Polypedilum vanderplanki]|uniref:Uncharacterized protein n=1 Tax=Polypedilum vanderplanki TaxID=319348 RepID=A0A9J6BZB8_POLVA|nr:hypothetical protein PVAND_005100 [Polypedilum vanderplanki]
MHNRNRERDRAETRFALAYAAYEQVREFTRTRNTQNHETRERRAVRNAHYRGRNRGLPQQQRQRRQYRPAHIREIERRERQRRNARHRNAEEQRQQPPQSQQQQSQEQQQQSSSQINLEAEPFIPQAHYSHIPNSGVPYTITMSRILVAPIHPPIYGLPSFFVPQPPPLPTQIVNTQIEGISRRLSAVDLQEQ